MEPTQTKPVKKRRRWLIVAFVLVLVSMGTWWCWPRGDARFVGKWSMFDSDAGETAAVMWLKSNGSGWSSEGSQQMYFSWHASDSELTVGKDVTGPIGQAVFAVAEVLLKLTGRTFQPGQMKFRVLSISAERIELEYEGASNLILERLPE